MDAGDEAIEELSARLDAVRAVMALVLRAVPDPIGLAIQLHDLERLMRQQNLHAGTIEEIVVWRAALDDL